VALGIWHSLKRTTTTAPHVVLWTGPPHSGKTTAIGELVERVRSAGCSVAGILAPSIWQNGELTGFDIVDLARGQRTSLAGRGQVGREMTGKFAFNASGLALGRAALTSPTAMTADLVVVDEFGPLELKGDGWRTPVDRLVARAAGVLLLVVRSALAESVGALYNIPTKRVIDARRVPAAIDAVLGLLAGPS